MVLLSNNKFFKSFGIAFIMIWIWFALQSLFSSYFFGDKFGMMFWVAAGLNSALLKIKTDIEHKKADY